MASSEFAKALAKRKNIQSLMKAANEAEKGGAYKLPNIDPGKYFVRVKLEGKVNPKTATPMLEIRWTIVDDSEFNGKGSVDTYWLESKDDPDRETKTWEFLGKALKVLTQDDDLQLEGPADLVAIIDEVNTANPIVEITLKKWKSKNSDKEGFTVYYNGIYEDDGSEVTPNDSVDTDDDTSEFTKGDIVEYDGEEWSIVATKDDTATLKSVDDPKVKKNNVPLDELTALA